MSTSTKKEQPKIKRLDRLLGFIIFLVFEKSLNSLLPILGCSVRHFVLTGWFSLGLVRAKMNGAKQHLAARHIHVSDTWVQQALGSGSQDIYELWLNTDIRDTCLAAPAVPAGPTLTRPLVLQVPAVAIFIATNFHHCRLIG